MKKAVEATPPKTTGNVFRDMLLLGRSGLRTRHSPPNRLRTSVIEATWYVLGMTLHQLKGLKLLQIQAGELGFEPR